MFPQFLCNWVLHPVLLDHPPSQFLVFTPQTSVTLLAFKLSSLSFSCFPVALAGLTVKFVDVL